MKEQLKQDYLALLDRLADKRTPAARKIAAVNAFCQKHKNPPWEKLEEATCYSVVYLITNGNTNVRGTTGAERQVIKYFLENKLARLRAAPQAQERLATAITNNDIPLVKLYLEHGMSLNKDFEGLPPLFRAVVNNYPVLTKLLIKHGAKVNQKIELGELGTHGILAFFTSGTFVNS